MKYSRIETGRFLERPNRFIAYVEIEGQRECVHVKNTGRCRELLYPGAVVYLQPSENPERKTKWDLIAVEKNGQIVNMDSQIPNKVVKEYIEKGRLFDRVSQIKTEVTYGNSRFDLYVETEEGRKIFIEVKGVTLEEDRIAKFPDAPSERAVKHVEELISAREEGYEAVVCFVIQMKQVRFLTPNVKTHPEFADALSRARESGVELLALDCTVKKNSITAGKRIPVILPESRLEQSVLPLIHWFRQHKRMLPWREDPTAYRVWVSEIMLQQTRVEAVKPFYARFMEALPTIEALAKAPEDRLLKLWEGLGYYNRVRNMQKAAIQIMEEYGGKFPSEYDQIKSLSGIGSYTAGAISSFAYGIPKPAVDGNVLRVVARLLGLKQDIMRQEVRTRIEQQLELVIPAEAASDFNQGLIEVGAMVCVPNGEPKCSECPLKPFCLASLNGLTDEIPVRSKGKARRIEERTVFVFRDGDTVAVKKRPDKGLLAGLYELPNLEGKLDADEAAAYAKEIGLAPIRVLPLPEGKHIFSHIEWHMTGYLIQVDELEKSCREEMIFAAPSEVEKKYPIPAAFETYTDYIEIKLGQEKFDQEGRRNV